MKVDVKCHSLVRPENVGSGQLDGLQSSLLRCPFTWLSLALTLQRQSTWLLSPCGSFFLHSTLLCWSTIHFKVSAAALTQMYTHVATLTLYFCSPWHWHGFSVTFYSLSRDKHSPFTYFFYVIEKILFLQSNYRCQIGGSTQATDHIMAFFNLIYSLIQ